MSDYEFDGQRLVAIPSPLPEEGDYEAALREYFPGAGDSDEAGIQLFGPAPGCVPYEWAVEITLNERCFAVWCVGFPELHAYLCHAAPMLAFLELRNIGGGVMDANGWHFGPASGLFASHGASEAQQYNRTVKHQSEHAEQPDNYARFAQYGLPAKTGSTQERTGTET